jgi:hypothetical protein
MNLMEKPLSGNPCLKNGSSINRLIPEYKGFASHLKHSAPVD